MDRDALWAMEVFVAVTEGGSLAAGARRLRVTPSAVSKQLAKLERRLRVRLLQRTTRSLRATPAGERYGLEARRAIAAAQAAEAVGRGEAEAIAGQLRVSAPTLLGQELVAPLAARFLAAHPGVTMELELTDRFVDLVGESVDVAVRVASRLPASGLVAARIGTLAWQFVASPAYVKARGLPRRPEELAAHACLDLAHGSDRGRWRMTFGRREATVDVRGPLVATSLTALHRAAREGLGIAQLPTYLVEDDLRERRLVVVLPSAGLARRAVWAVQPSRAFVPGRVRAFVAALSAGLRAG